MADFKRLMVEGRPENGDLSTIHEILGDMKAHFSGRCRASETTQPEDSRGKTACFLWALEGDMDFADIESLRLFLIKLINLGFRISCQDRLEKQTVVTHANNALIYGEPVREAPSEAFSPGGPVASSVREIKRLKRWPRHALYGVALILALLAYRSTWMLDSFRTAPSTITKSASEARSSDPSHAPEPSSQAPPPPPALPSLEVPQYTGGALNPDYLNKRKLDQLQKIVRDYRAAHTYSMEDLFVCVDMAVGLWNILKTKGVPARIMAGRVDEDITHLKGLDYIGKINHAWVVAEPEPGIAIPLEATGGYLVTPETPNYRLYLEGTDFRSPKNFKSFIELRTRGFDTCREAQSMEEHFNATFAGKRVTQDSIAYKGRLEQKVQDCTGILAQLQETLRQRD